MKDDEKLCWVFFVIYTIATISVGFDAKGRCRKEYMKEYMKEYYQRPEVKKRMKEYVCPQELCADFDAYFSRLWKRTKPSKRKELLNKKDELKERFVHSVGMVIDGGMELKVAEKLGVKYEKGVLK